ncbi:MAG TPA: EamA family transporter [Flavobacterium sp.]|nr:EamA family transporter [Flavobacterium sp.]
MLGFKNKFTIQLVAAFASIYVIWGSTFLAISIALQGFPPFLLSGFRFIIAGLILFIWQRGREQVSNSWINWKKNAITGTLILTGGTGLVAWGEQYVSSTEAAIAIATGPFWFIALDKKNWKNYFSNFPVASGLVIGFTGLILFLGGSVSSSGHGSSFVLRITAFSVLALSSISWVVGSLYSKKKPANQPFLINSAQQLLAAGTASILIALFKGEWASFSIASVPPASWFGLLFLIFFGSIVAYLSYIWLLKVKDPVLVSTHTYINPIVAVLVGWAVASEQIEPNQLIGLFVILLGVLLTNMSQYKLSRRTRVKIRRLKAVLQRISNPYKYITH